MKNETIKKLINLYEDWLLTRKTKDLKKMKSILEDSTSGVLNFINAVKEMKEDGVYLHKIFTEDWSYIAKDPTSAKRKMSKLMLSSTRKIIKEDKNGSVVTDIGQSYYPVADRSKSMESEIDLNDRDIIIQIRHAITGGNMMIAQELIKNSWGDLSLKQRNGLIEFANAIGQYNSETPDVPKGRLLKMKTLEKRSDLTKDEFAEKLIHTAMENMKVQ